jgi:hypothetical protein
MHCFLFHLAPNWLCIPDGNLIFGQYSYIEPRGSLVIVKYTVGKDGNGYTEKRLLTVNYR